MAILHLSHEMGGTNSATSATAALRTGTLGGHTDEMRTAWSAHAAGHAAGARAAECHIRLEELRDATRATTRADANRAHEAFVRAAFRAALAEDRSAAAAHRVMTSATLPDQERHAAIGRSRPILSAREADTYDVQRERMGLLGVSLDELWINYAALCGTYSRLELEAYLNGVLEFGPTDRVRIDQALWELGDSG